MVIAKVIAPLITLKALIIQGPCVCSKFAENQPIKPEKVSNKNAVNQIVPRKTLYEHKNVEMKENSYDKSVGAGQSYCN